VNGRGAPKNALKIFQLLKPIPDTTAVKRGIEIEPDVIRLYLSALGEVTYSMDYPSIVQHRSYHYIVFSPDGILTLQKRGKTERVPIEVKTSLSSTTQKKFTDCKNQIFLGMWVTGCTKAVLIHFRAPWFKVPKENCKTVAEIKYSPNAEDFLIKYENEADVFLETLTVTRNKEFDQWVVNFENYSRVFYETYLRWYHDGDAKKGSDVMTILQGTLDPSNQIVWP
jgi:hypothetical protein